MEALTQIIKTLSSGEVRLVRNFYKIQSNGEVKRRLHLFDLIKEKKVKADEEAARLIYKKAPDSAFSHLKKRLKGDILNLLLLQDSSKRYEPPFAKAEFDCRRMFIAGDLLIARGAYVAGVEVLTKAAMLAEKYELFNEQILIDDVLRVHQGRKLGVEEYERYNQRIAANLVKLEKYLNSRDAYQQIVLPNLFHSNKGKKFIDYSERTIVKLKEYYEETGSTRIGFYYYYTCMFYYQLNGKLDRALEYALKQLELTKKEPAIYSNRKVASAHLQIAYIQIHTANYKESIIHAKEARANYKKGMLNELLANEVLFFACYWNRDYQQAEEVINIAFAHPKINSNKLNPAKWNYFKTILAFATGDFELCQDLLNKSSELLKDKSGWLMGHKLLEIICLVELNYMDLIDFRIESFRKLLQRQKGEDISRIKCIVGVLDTFVKTGKQFGPTYEQEKKNLKLLQEAGKGCSWDPTGYELVRFDEWFMSKVPVKQKVK